MKFLMQIFNLIFFRYIIAGGIASFMDIILFNVLVYMSGTYYIFAVIISNAISFFIRFFLQKHAFKAYSKENIYHQLFAYGILFIVSVGLTALFMYILVDFIGINKSISQIISILIVASVCFFIYRDIVFSDSKKTNKLNAKRLLIITQKVDKDDSILGFFHTWINELAKKFDSVIVICLEMGKFELSENVKVLSLGKEERQSRLQYLIHFYWYILNEMKNYDAVFVHMNQQYVILGAIIWNVLAKNIYMWRNHVSGSMMTKMAVRLCKKVFCTSEFSYTARYKNHIIMPVGIDTDLFKRRDQILKIPKSILFLGRIAPIKKPHFLCEALISLKKKGINFTASFYGDPIPSDEKYYKDLQERINKEGLSKNIFFHRGIRNYETVDIYNTHEVSINLSPSGLYDKTIFEAMACETMILASSRSLYGLIQENFIFKEGYVFHLAHKIERILNLDKKEKIERGKEFRSIVIEKHSLEKLIIQLSKNII